MNGISHRCMLLGTLATLMASIIGATCGCSRRNSSGSRVVKSPDGRFVVEATINLDRAQPRYKCVRIRVFRNEKDQRIEEFETQTAASDRLRWDISWESENRIVMRSADIGTKRWRRDENGSWSPTDQTEPQ